MKLKPSFLLKLTGLTVCALSLVQDLKAQPFTYTTNDIFIGFRKTGVNQGFYELVVNIGQGTSYIGMTPGSVSNIANFSPTQLSDAFTDFNNLNWSVSGGQDGTVAPPPGYPARTLWLTAPRTNINVQSAPIQRQSTASQQVITIQEIQSVLEGAKTLSSGLPADQDNNTVLVREPAADGNAYSSFVSGSDPTLGTYQDNLPRTIEVVTPASFTSPVRADFYEVRPTGFTDPNTGLTNGNAYYAGYFQLNPDGTMTFTRATANTPPPPAPTLKITRSGGVNTISFGTTSGATYTLYLTNSSGLSHPISTWPTNGSLVGDGNTNSLPDTTTDSNRFYSVGAH